jgi:hypothetical protein
MTPEPNSLHCVARLGDTLVEKRLTFAPGSFGYTFADAKCPNCLKFWIDRRTFIIPVQNLLIFELDT